MVRCATHNRYMTTEILDCGYNNPYRTDGCEVWKPPASTELVDDGTSVSVPLYDLRRLIDHAEFLEDMVDQEFGSCDGPSELTRLIEKLRLP